MTWIGAPSLLSDGPVRLSLLEYYAVVSLINSPIRAERRNFRPLERQPISAVLAVTTKEAAPDSSANVVFHGRPSFEEPHSGT
jgi:hypothetical protein